MQPDGKPDCDIVSATKSLSPSAAAAASHSALLAGTEAQLPDICSVWVAYCPAGHVCGPVKFLTKQLVCPLLGWNLPSGQALQALLQMHLKLLLHEELWGEGLLRELNFRYSPEENKKQPGG